MKKILATMLLGALPALSSFTFAQEMTEQSSNRLEARLNPVIAVDASGQARLDIAAGVTNDRFTAEVEIAKDDFGPLGITPGNGFRDEVVELRILRGGAVIFNHVLQFSRNLANDITFEKKAGLDRHVYCRPIRASDKHATDERCRRAAA